MDNKNLPATTSLFKLSEDLVALDQLMEEIANETESAVAHEMQQQLYKQITAKVDGCEEYLKMLKFAEDFYRQKEEDAYALKTKAKNKAQSFSNYLKSCLDYIGVKELRGEWNKITLRQGLERAEIVDENEIPPEYLRVKQVVEVDKLKILAALKDGQEVPGAKLVRGESKIQIKPLI